MAFAVKYRKKFQRIGVTKTYRIEILSEAGGGVITPWKMGADPFQLKTLGAERDEDKIVIGSEVTFEFVDQKRNNETDYDPLFESEYRDHIVRFYEEGPEKLLWQGYLQPENMYKSMFESNLHIYLSATDALKDLDTFDFKNTNGNIVTGHWTGLAILKLCLTNLDQDSQFQYDFIIKCGTKHTGQGANDTALHDITHDTRRFTKITDGKTEIDSCLTVIEKVLYPYSCTLQQYGGKYYIKSKYEVATNYYTYHWDLSFHSKALSADVVNIDNYKFRRDADVSFISPVKEVGLRLLNRNIGGSLVPNINDYLAANDVWDYSNYNSTKDDTKTYMCLTAENGVPPGNNGYVTLKNNVSIAKITDGDYLKLRFSYRHMTNGISWDGWPQFQIKVVKDGTVYDTFSPMFINGNGYVLYESEVNAVFKLTGVIGVAHNYNFQIEIITNDPFNDYEIRMIDFDLTRAIIIEGENYEDVVFDTFYKAISTKGKIKVDAEDFHFGDSGTITDFAALVYAAAVTYEWDREGGGADNQTLLYLWAKNFLISRQDYTEYIICEIKDSGDNITPVNYIEWNGKNYHIVSFEKSYRSSWISLHLKQWLTSDLTVGWERTPLTSVDGQGSGASSPYIPPSVGAAWDMITGKPSWITGETTVGGNLVDLVNPGAISFIRINADNTVSALSDVNFKTALALQNVTNESKATMFTNSTFTGTTTVASLIVEDLTDGYVPYQKAADDKLSNSNIYYDGTNTGIGTTSPTTADGSARTFQIGDRSVIQDTVGTQTTIANNAHYDGTWKYIVASYASAIRLNGLGTTGDITFSTAPSGAAGGTITNWDTSNIRMTILNGGNVGIGTVSPTVSLQVAGTGIKSEIVQSVTAYSTGFFGDGYKVSESGGETTAEFDNLIVRKLLKAYTLEIDEIDVVGGSLVISPASGTAYSVTSNIGEYTSWTNLSFETFISSGLNLISVINTSSTGDIAYITQHYHATLGETIKITGTIVLNSGVLPIIQISEDAGTITTNYALAAGVNTINHVITDPGVCEIFLYCNAWANCNFSFTGITITSDIERITFDTNGGVNPIQFKVDDYIASQQWVNYDHTIIESYRGQVLAVCQSATLGSAYIQVTTISGAMWTGMKLAQLGNSSDAARQNLLYLTSSDSNNPYIEGHSGVSAGVFSDTTRKFRVGNLVGITDPVLGALTGHGIYTQHGYFTGISAFGSSIGLDPESVDTNNVSIVGCNIYESSRNDDTGSLYINSIGYQGGTTHFRNTYIGDGKFGYLLQAVGEGHFVSIQQAFGFYPHIFANDYAPAEIFNVVYILSGAGASKTLTLPIAADVVSQFGAGKSATVPFIIVINQSGIYNLNITTVGNVDTFWYSGANTKTYVLAPNRSIIMTFADPEWYIIET